MIVVYLWAYSQSHNYSFARGRVNGQARRAQFVGALGTAIIATFNRLGQCAGEDLIVAFWAVDGADNCRWSLRGQLKWVRVWALCARQANEKVAFASTSVKATLIKHDQGVTRVAELHVNLMLLGVTTSFKPNLRGLAEASLALGHGWAGGAHAEESKIVLHSNIPIVHLSRWVRSICLIVDFTIVVAMCMNVKVTSIFAGHVASWDIDPRPAYIATKIDAFDEVIAVQAQLGRHKLFQRVLFCTLLYFWLLPGRDFVLVVFRPSYITILYLRLFMLLNYPLNAISKLGPHLFGHLLHQLDDLLYFTTFLWLVHYFIGTWLLFLLFSSYLALRICLVLRICNS